MTQQWQYHVVPIDCSIGPDAIRLWLDGVGKDGWELVDVVPAGQSSSSRTSPGFGSLGESGTTAITNVTLYLKRPLPT